MPTAVPSLFVRGLGPAVACCRVSALEKLDARAMRLVQLCEHRPIEFRAAQRADLLDLTPLIAFGRGRYRDPFRGSDARQLLSSASQSVVPSEDR